MSKNKDAPELQLIKGVDKKDPSRINKNAPKGPPIGNPPRWLSKEQKVIWREIKREVVDGVLQKSDRKMMEILCVLLQKFRKNPDDFPSGKLTRIESILSKFGMSPSDRRNVVVPEVETENPFDKY